MQDATDERIRNIWCRLFRAEPRNRATAQPRNRAIVQGVLLPNRRPIFRLLVGRVTSAFIRFQRDKPCAPVLADGHHTAGKGLPALPDCRVSVPTSRTSGVVPGAFAIPRRVSSIPSRTSGVASRSSVPPPLASGVARRRLILSRRNFGFCHQMSANTLNINNLRD